MWFVLNDISSSLKTFVDSCTRLRNFCNREIYCKCIIMYILHTTTSSERLNQCRTRDLDWSLVPTLHTMQQFIQKLYSSVLQLIQPWAASLKQGWEARLHLFNSTPSDCFLFSNSWIPVDIVSGIHTPVFTYSVVLPKTFKQILMCKIGGVLLKVDITFKR